MHNSKAQSYRSICAYFQQSFVISSVIQNFNEAARLELYFSYNEAKQTLKQKPFTIVFLQRAKLMSDLRSIVPLPAAWKSSKTSWCYPPNGGSTSVLVSVVSLKVSDFPDVKDWSYSLFIIKQSPENKVLVRKRINWFLFYKIVYLKASFKPQSER